MREIKFRVWTGKQMIYQDKQYLASFIRRIVPRIILDHGGEAFYQHESYLPNGGLIDEYLMQFTGLKDKHGKEVYEGAIYRNLDNGLIGKFYYLNGPGGYTLYCRENNADGSPYNMLPFMQLDTTNFEIIGNIYETPELTDKRMGL